ncbi:MAG: pentapeptide repeat-containing protein, partial [Cyanobacteria bacterium J06588_4]
MKPIKSANQELGRNCTAMKADLLKQAYSTGRRNFSHSHLQNVCLHKAYLAEINLCNAYLNRAVLSRTNFERA